MNTIQFRRQGVSNSLNSRLPKNNRLTGYPGTKDDPGDHIQLFYHHGLREWLVDRSITKSDGSCFRHIDSICIGEIDHPPLAQVGKYYDVNVHPDIEAYMYYSEEAYSAYPRIYNDVFYLAAYYDPEEDTVFDIEHNKKIIGFYGQWPNKAFCYPTEKDDDSDPVWKHIKSIDRALKEYNSNVQAHGTGIEHKEQSCWLLSEYMRKEGAKTRLAYHVNKQKDIERHAVIHAD